MAASEAEVMSPEQIWALVGDEDVEQYRGEPVEITAFDHKRARDFAIFASAVGKDREIDNVVVVHDGTTEDHDDEEFFDIVRPSKPLPNL